MADGTAVDVKFYLNDDTNLSGKAYLDSLSIDVAAEDKANISISLTGISELTLSTLAS